MQQGEARTKPAVIEQDEARTKPALIEQGPALTKPAASHQGPAQTKPAIVDQTAPSDGTGGAAGPFTGRYAHPAPPVQRRPGAQRPSGPPGYDDWNDYNDYFVYPSFFDSGTYDDLLPLPCWVTCQTDPMFGCESMVGDCSDLGDMISCDGRTYSCPGRERSQHSRSLSRRGRRALDADSRQISARICPAAAAARQ